MYDESGTSRYFLSKKIFFFFIRLIVQVKKGHGRSCAVSASFSDRTRGKMEHILFPKKVNNIDTI